MVCIYCGGATSVTNSRLQRRSNTIWRRRRCASCGALFTSGESTVTELAFTVRDATGELAAFKRDLLFLAVLDSCKHRPTALDDATALTAIILDQLLGKQTGGVIERRDIAKITHQALERFDTTAATIYRAYHPG